jgi:hypothetical protein
VFLVIKKGNRESTRFDRWVKNEKGGSTKQAEGKFPVNLTPSLASTSFTAPKDHEIICFYLLEIEILGGD